MRPALQATSLPALTALLLLLPAPLGAQLPRDTVRRDTVIRVEGIHVRATRPVTTAGAASAIEVRIDSLVLPAVASLERVLREVPMVHVRTNSRGEAEIALRGSESRQVAVLVDGVPLTMGWDARTDVSVIPATAPRTLTLVRGLASVLHGPNVLGGVIELGVGHGGPRARRSVGLHSSVDHVGGLATSLTGTVPIPRTDGALLLRGGLGWRDSPGLPAADIVQPGDAGDLRLNTDHRQLEAFLSLRRDWDAGAWLSFSGSGFRAERGIAAELGVSEPRLWRYPHVARTLAVLSGGTGDRASPLGGRGDVELSLGLDVGRTEIDEYASFAYDEVVGGEVGDDRTTTLRLLADQTLLRRGELRTAFTFADIRHDETVADLAPARYRQRLWSAGGELVWPAGDAGAFRNVRLTLGGALDGADTPESADKPALGALRDWGARTGISASLLEGRARVHAGASRRVRFPSLRELYSGALGRFEPNPALTAERLTAFEAGITASTRSGEIQLVGFHHRLDDAIVRILTEAGRFQRVNRDQQRSTGLELVGSASVGPVAVGGDLTWQHVALHDPAAAETRRPEHQPRIFGSVHARASLFARIDGGVRVHHTGSQYCVDPESGADRELATGTRVSADLGRVWTLARGDGWFSRLDARVAVENALDATTYDLCALPQPGRLARLQLRLF